MIVRTARENHNGHYKISVTPYLFSTASHCDTRHSIKITFKEIEASYELAHDKR